MDYNEQWNNGANTHDDVEEAIKQKVQELQQGINNAGSEAASKYAKPASGIPKTDLAPAVRTSLEKADNAYQKPASGIPASDLASGVIPSMDDFATKTELADKVDKVNGKGLSTNDYTDADKTKLNGIADNATANEGTVTAVIANGQTVEPDDEGIVNLGPIGGEKGDKGDTVVIGDEELFLIINDLVTGGESDALSAEMGRRLAVGGGSFANAWARTMVQSGVFCWLLVDSINGQDICKLIFHKGGSVFIDALGSIVNYNASDYPNAPTITGASNGDSIDKGSVITITPPSGAAVFYKINNGEYVASDKQVALKMTTPGVQNISAYCKNNKGDSLQEASLMVIVKYASIPVSNVPEGEVERGSQVVISSDNELHYSLDGGTTWVTATDNDGKSATITVDGGTQSSPLQIMAYDQFVLETGETVTFEYWQSELEAPIFFPNGGELASGGGYATLHQRQGADIYYTTDGSTPTTSSTKYTQPVQMSASTTIKAIAHDPSTNETSSVSEATFTIWTPSIVIVSDGQNTFRISKAYNDYYDFTLDNGENTITLTDINTAFGTSYTSFADYLFYNVSFGDKTKIVKFNGGGIQLKGISNLFAGSSSEANTTLEECSGVVLHDIQNGADVGGSSYQPFFNCDNVSLIEISGKAIRIDSSFGFGKFNVIDLSNLEFNDTRHGFMLNNAEVDMLIVGSGFIPVTNGTTNCFVNNKVKVLRVASSQPPQLDFDWVGAAINANANIRIQVPSNSLSLYAQDQLWGNYMDHIEGY